jgi:two-component system, OmpR family, sensor histidine kinase BaeS
MATMLGPMRLRLWHRLFFAFAVLSGLALAGFVGWQQLSFRSGFLTYLNEVSRERLAAVSERLAARYRERGDWDFLRRDPAQLDQLLDPSAVRPRRPPGPPFGDGPPRGDSASPPAPDDALPTDDRRPPPGRMRPQPPPRSDALDLRSRVALLDAQGVPIAGAGVGPEAESIAVVVDGQTVGTLRMAPLPRLLGGLDLQFAAAQRQDALVAGIAVLAISLLLAFAIARWLLAPIHALAEGTRALAAGDYARRIAAQRNDELGALSRDFNHLAATLEQHRQARQQWGADIAHELRTPLSILRGEIQALQDGIRAVTPQTLDSLQIECERLGHLIEDLYQLALADAGALDYRFETLDLAELVQEALSLQRPACDDAGLVLDADSGAAAFVRGDARRLAQLLDNLIANARRYTDAPGRIHIELTLAGAQVRLTVEDTAPGVPAEALPRIFERLYRVERSRNRDKGGAGLGLAICRAIVDAHGGRIHAQASPLGGLRVSVLLPAAGVLS